MATTRIATGEWHGSLLEGSGLRHAFLRNGCGGDDVIVAHGPQTCIGHHSGSRVTEPSG